MNLKFCGLWSCPWWRQHFGKRHSSTISIMRIFPHGGSDTGLLRYRPTIELSVTRNCWQVHMRLVGLEWVFGINPGVRVFAPQYPTWKGRVLGQLWYLPVSKTILIDLTLDTWQRMLKILWPWKIWHCPRHIFQTFVSMDHFASGASVFWYSIMWTRTRLHPYLILFKYPIPDQYLIFHTSSTPSKNGNF